jgi:hypothetical protein
MPRGAEAIRIFDGPITWVFYVSPTVFVSRLKNRIHVGGVDGTTLEAVGEHEPMAASSSAAAPTGWKSRLATLRRDRFGFRLWLNPPVRTRHRRQAP